MWQLPEYSQWSGETQSDSICSQPSPILPQINILPKQGPLGHYVVKTATQLTSEQPRLLCQHLFLKEKAPAAQSTKEIFLNVVSHITRLK